MAKTVKYVMEIQCCHYCYVCLPPVALVYRNWRVPWRWFWMEVPSSRCSKGTYKTRLIFWGVDGNVGMPAGAKVLDPHWVTGPFQDSMSQPCIETKLWKLDKMQCNWLMCQKTSGCSEAYIFAMQAGCSFPSTVVGLVQKHWVFHQ